MVGPAKPKVLAVETDPVSRRILVRALERLGHSVIEASDGRGAIEALERDRPQIVVTDWMMPEADGLEVCRRVRARSAGRTTYVIALAARSERADVVSALEAGADELLAKPLDVGELCVRLATAERILSLESALAARAGDLESALGELLESKERLVAAERLAAVGEVGMAMKHEVNNPLAGILGLADLVVGDPRPELSGAIDALRRIRDLARRIAAIMSRLDAPSSAATVAYMGGARMLDLGRDRPA